MKHTGKYIYGIIATEEAPNFGPMGVGGHHEEVTTLGVKGLAAVVSNASMDHYVISRENLSAHTRVVEKVMESYTVLPMRFCTVAETADEIIAFLEKNAKVLKNMIKEMDGKVEMDIKIFWKEVKKVYEEIVKENKKIRELKARSHLDRSSLIAAGERVAQALEEKKEAEQDRYFRPLQKKAKAFKKMEAAGDTQIGHAAFLVEKGWLKEFEAAVDALEDAFAERIDIRLVGPMAPFSFINLQLHWDE